MTLKITRPASLAVLVLLLHACATPGPPALTASEPAATAIRPVDGPAAPSLLRPEHSLPGLASFEDLSAVRPGDLQVFRWDRSPQVFVFIYPDLAAQARALNRIATFVEKAHAPRNRVLSEAELSAAIQASGKTEQTYYLGHDYTAGALADFFNTAPSSGVVLNPQEQELRSRLLRLGFFTEAEQGRLLAQAPERVLISVAPEASPFLTTEDQRLKFAAVLRHELSHAEFFINPAYREYCLQAWNALSDHQRRIFTEELARLGYDTTNTLLLINEFQAFLWEPQAGFIMDVKLKKQNGSLARLRAAFIAGLNSRHPAITAIFTIPGFAEPMVWRERSQLVKSLNPSYRSPSPAGHGPNQTSRTALSRTSTAQSPP